MVWFVEEIGVGLREGRRHALGCAGIYEITLEDRDRIEVGRTSGTGTKSSAGEGQLPAGRAVGGIAQKIEAKQGVVIEDL